MKEKPIIFRGDGVRAILEGRKSQTRRIIKPQPEGEPFSTLEWANNLANASGVLWNNPPTEKGICEKADRLKGKLFPFRKPGGQRFAIRPPYAIGDRLWVRETWRQAYPKTSYSDGIIYKADKEGCLGMAEYCGKWKSPRFMFKKYARIWLEVTRIRVERVQDITEQDALDEGIKQSPGKVFYDPREPGLEPSTLFADLWNSIHGPDAWQRNDWVFVYDFARRTP